MEGRKEPLKQVQRLRGVFQRIQVREAVVWSKSQETKASAKSTARPERERYGRGRPLEFLRML
jgi:hypothetical protein